MLTIYTDGACKGNPGPGGWAAVILNNNEETIISGNKKFTTNNHMELLAPLQGLFTLSKPSEVTIITDSMYVVDGFMKKWYEKWIEEEQYDRPNFELWRMLYNLKDIHDIKFEWVKGHSGNHYNELCDKLAEKEARKLGGLFTTNTNYYAVAKGRVTGIFYNWTDCEKQVKGYKGAKFKKFSFLEEAEQFIKENK